MWPQDSPLLTPQWWSRRRLLSSAGWLLPGLWVCQVWLWLCSNTLWFPPSEQFEPLNFQAAGLGTGYRFFFQTFGISVMIFVSKGYKSTSDVAPCTMNLALKHQWATSKTRAPCGDLVSGDSLLSRCAHQPGTQCLLRHLQLKTGCQICHRWQIGMLGASNHVAFRTSMEYTSGFELCGKKKCIIYMQNDLKIKWKEIGVAFRAQHRVLLVIVCLKSTLTCPELFRLERWSQWWKLKGESQTQ